MSAHLAEIARNVAPGAHALLILDGAGRHGSASRVVPGNISLPTLPPCSPELNPVENVRACLRANKLAITVFDTCDDILNACCTARNLFADDPKAIASITSRDWAQVNQQGRWYEPLAMGEGPYRAAVDPEATLSRFGHQAPQGEGPVRHPGAQPVRCRPTRDAPSRHARRPVRSRSRPASGSL